MLSWSILHEAGRGEEAGLFIWNHFNFLVVLSFFIVPQYMALKSTGSSFLINSFLEIRFILIYNIKKFDYLKLDTLFSDPLLFNARVISIRA